MTEETSGKPAKRSLLRKIILLAGIGIALLLLVNLLFPDLDFSIEDRVALIRVEGVIMDAQSTVTELKRFGENPSIKAIVLRIDSPGGGVVPSQEIYDAVQRVRNKNNKAVIASMGTVAASGGYYIAAATDRIVANPGTIHTMLFGLVDLSKPNIVLAVAAGAVQFYQSWQIFRKPNLTNQPPAEVKETKAASDESMAAAMNKQMMYLMPIMTVIIGISLPGGLTLYWLTMSALTVAQQALFLRKPQPPKPEPQLS